MPNDLEHDPILKNVPEVEGYKVLEPCVLYGKLGQGGMGTVYRGKHINLDIDVAVKCLRPSLAASDQGLVARFEREAKVAASISNQNLIRVYDVDAQHGVHYLVMEYVEGETGSERVARKGALDQTEAARILLGSAHGLAAAHRTGVVHRDIKPDNILVSHSGEVKVADLGLAKAMEGNEGVTMTQVMMGTPNYMPPEQWEDVKTVGPPGDVYALGATAYYLLCGENPISGASFAEVMRKACTEPFPDILEKCPDLDPGLVAILKKCTEAKAADRYQNAGELVHALESWGGIGPGSLVDPEAGLGRQGEPLLSPPPSNTLATIKIAMEKGTHGLTTTSQRHHKKISDSSVVRKSQAETTPTGPIPTPVPTVATGDSTVAPVPPTSRRLELIMGAIVVLLVAVVLLLVLNNNRNEGNNNSNTNEVAQNNPEVTPTNPPVTTNNQGANNNIETPAPVTPPNPESTKKPDPVTEKPVSPEPPIESNSNDNDNGTTAIKNATHNENKKPNTEPQTPPANAPVLSPAQEAKKEGKEFLKSANFAMSIEYFRRARELDPNINVGFELGNALYQQAKDYQQRNRLDDAYESAQSAIAENYRDANDLLEQISGELRKTIQASTQILAPAEGAIAGSTNVEVRVAVNFPGLKSVEIDGKEASSEGSEYTATINRQHGASEAMVRITDNRDITVELPVAIRVDAENPVLRITEPLDGRVSGETVIIRGTVADDTTCSITVNGTAVALENGNWEFSVADLKEGKNDYRVVATDAVGRTSEETKVLVSYPTPPEQFDYVGVNIFGQHEYRLRKDPSLVFVLVRGNQFSLGREGEADATPISQITLESYLIAKFEVSNAQFARFWIDKMPATTRLPDPPRELLTQEQQDLLGKGGDAAREFLVRYYTELYPNLPVVNVTYDHAEDYCEWAGERGGKEWDRVRLPYETEWEYAAKGANNLLYPWGNEFDPNKTNYSGAESRFSPVMDTSEEGRALWKQDGHLYAAPVDAYPEGASPFGLLNMAGNVAEWCDTVWGNYSRVAKKGRTGNFTARDSQMVIRGGSFQSVSQVLTTTSRDRYSRRDSQGPRSSRYLGFRPACTFEKSE